MLELYEHFGFDFCALQPKLKLFIDYEVLVSSCKNYGIGRRYQCVANYLNGHLRNERSMMYCPLKYTLSRMNKIKSVESASCSDVEATDWQVVFTNRDCDGDIELIKRYLDSYIKEVRGEQDADI